MNNANLPNDDLESLFSEITNTLSKTLEPQVQPQVQQQVQPQVQQQVQPQVQQQVQPQAQPQMQFDQSQIDQMMAQMHQQQTLVQPVSPQPQAVQAPTQPIAPQAPQATQQQTTAQPDFSGMFANLNVDNMVNGAISKVDMNELNNTAPLPPITSQAQVNLASDQSQLDQVFGGMLQTQPQVQQQAQVQQQVQTQPQVQSQAQQQVQAQPQVQPQQSMFKAKKTQYTSDLALTQATLEYRPDIRAFQNDTNISDAYIDQCMINQTSLFAYWSSVHADAEFQVSKAKRQLDDVESTLYQIYRKVLIAGGEKPTERLIDSYIRRDATYEEAYDTHALACRYASTHKSNVNALVHRRDMLIQRGASLREESKGKIRINGGNESIMPNIGGAGESHVNAIQYAQQSLNKTY